MEKELKSSTGVLLRADLTGHGQFSQSANFCQEGWDGMAMPCYVSPQKDFNSFSIMLCYIISTTYQKIGDLFCPVIFLDFRTVWQWKIRLLILVYIHTYVLETRFV